MVYTFFLSLINFLHPLKVIIVKTLNKLYPYTKFYFLLFVYYLLIYYRFRRLQRLEATTISIPKSSATTKT